MIVATFLARRRRGLTRPGELGLVAGCLALVAVFVATLPLVAAHVAIAVQLQVSRVFWMADVLAMLGIVWWLAEARPASASREAAPAAATRPRWVFAAAAAFALGRGSYAMLVEHPDRPLFARVGPRRRLVRRLGLPAPGHAARHPRPRRPQPRLALRHVAPRPRRPRRVPRERQGRGDEHVRSADGAARRRTAPRPRRLRARTASELQALGRATICRSSCRSASWRCRSSTATSSSGSIASRRDDVDRCSRRRRLARRSPPPPTSRIRAGRAVTG